MSSDKAPVSLEKHEAPGPGEAALPYFRSMKPILIAFAGALCSLSAFGQSRIVVEVSNFRNNKGVCRACLFNSAGSFNGQGKPVQCVQVGVQGNRTSLEFANVAAGTYAVSVFHDANNNNQFDRNFLGIPREGYGASKNELPFASAPSFDENKFVVQASSTTHLSIRLRNL